MHSAGQRPKTVFLGEDHPRLFGFPSRQQERDRTPFLSFFCVVCHVYFCLPVQLGRHIFFSIVVCLALPHKG